jgi:hypothetical protein
MITPRIACLFCFLCFCFCVISCASPTKDSLNRGQDLSVAEQTERTRDALQEISRMSVGADPKEIRVRREAVYIDIIEKYPGSQLVYGCYNELMLIYLRV